MFYVYEWYVIETNEIIYVGKGCKNRYRVRKHNKLFNEIIKRYECDSRIIKTFDTEEEAFNYEYVRISELKDVGQCVCNIYDGGFGGDTKSWTVEKRKKYSEYNVMKSQKQRYRMSTHNPMKDKNVAEKVGNKHKRSVTIGINTFDTVISASNFYNVKPHEIYKWLKSGVSSNNEKCFYTDGKIRHIKHPNRKKPSCKKSVIVDNQFFNTSKDACEFLGISQHTLPKWIEKEQPYKGHICKYANQQPSHGKSDNSTLEGSTTNK